MVELASLVLFTGDLDAARRFYGAVGIGLEDEDHGEGPRHMAAELGDVHFALYEAGTPGRAAERRTAGGVLPGFYVASLDEAWRAVEALDAPVLSRHEVMPWGCRFLVEDPDGRAVEVNQRAHCATTPAEDTGSPQVQPAGPLAGRTGTTQRG